MASIQQLLGQDMMDTSRLQAILSAAQHADAAGLGRAENASPGLDHRGRMHGLHLTNTGSSDSGAGGIPLSDLALLSQLQGLTPSSAFLQPGLAVQGQAGQLKLPIGLEELSKMGRGAVGMPMGSLGGAPIQTHSHKPTRSTDSRSSSAYASRHQAAEQRRRTRINERLELLRKMVPHAERANTACFLEEVIKYIDSLKRRTVELEAALGLKSAKSPSLSDQPEQPMANSNGTAHLAPSPLAQFSGLQQAQVHQQVASQSVCLPPGAQITHQLTPQQHSALLAAAAQQHGGISVQHQAQPQQLQVLSGSTYVSSPLAHASIQHTQAQSSGMLQIDGGLAGLPNMPIPQDMQTTLPSVLQQHHNSQPTLSSGSHQYSTSMGASRPSFQVQFGNEMYVVKADPSSNGSATNMRLPMVLNTQGAVTIGVGPNGAPTLQLPPGITPEQLLMAAQAAQQQQSQQHQYTSQQQAPQQGGGQQQQHVVMHVVQQQPHVQQAQHPSPAQAHLQQSHMAALSQALSNGGQSAQAALAHMSQLLPAGLEPVAMAGVPVPGSIMQVANGVGEAANGAAEGEGAAGAGMGNGNAGGGSGAGTPVSSEESGVPVKKRKVLQL